METTTVLDTDSIVVTARKIFYDFILHQSCSVRGLVEDGEYMESKGSLVVKELERLDVVENYDKGAHRRKRVKLPNTVGGFVAQKIFKFKEEKRNGQVYITIWRIQ